MPIWKDVPGYEGYYIVSNEGEVLAVLEGTRKHANGYSFEYVD